MNTDLIAFIRNIIGCEDISYIRRIAGQVLLSQIDANTLVTIFDDHSGQSFRMRPDDHDSIQKQWYDGQKINAIKALRTLTNWGLFEAKKAMENPKNFQQPYDR